MNTQNSVHFDQSVAELIAQLRVLFQLTDRQEAARKRLADITKAVKAQENEVERAFAVVEAMVTDPTPTEHKDPAGVLLQSQNPYATSPKTFG